MELNPDNRTEMIKARVSEEEKNLIKAKAEYYGYKQLSKYIRDAAIYEKVTVVDLIGKNEILKAYSDNTQILKEMIKLIDKKLDLECIENYQDTEPIFIEDVKKYIIEKCGKQNNDINNISVILNRLKIKGILLK